MGSLTSIENSLEPPRTPLMGKREFFGKMDGNTPPDIFFTSIGLNDLLEKVKQIEKDEKDQMEDEKEDEMDLIDEIPKEIDDSIMKKNMFALKLNSCEFLQEQAYESKGSQDTEFNFNSKIPFDSPDFEASRKKLAKSFHIKMKTLSEKVSKI